MSLRQASIKTGLSHTTIRDIIKKGRASVVSVAKLAATFSGDGTQQKLLLEDELLVMAGYRSPRPDEGGENNQMIAKLSYLMSGFSLAGLKLMRAYAEYLRELEVNDGQKKWNEARKEVKDVAC